MLSSADVRKSMVDAHDHGVIGCRQHTATMEGVFAPLLKLSGSVPKPPLGPRATARRIFVNTDPVRPTYYYKQGKRSYTAQLPC